MSLLIQVIIVFVVSMLLGCLADEYYNRKMKRK